MDPTPSQSPPPSQSLGDTVNEYNDFLNRGGDQKSMSLRDYAMMQDAVEGGQKRAAAYTPKPSPSALQMLEKLAEPINTGLSAVSKGIARLPITSVGQ